MTPVFCLNNIMGEETLIVYVDRFHNVTIKTRQDIRVWVTDQEDFDKIKNEYTVTRE